MGESLQTENPPPGGGFAREGAPFRSGAGLQQGGKKPFLWEMRVAETLAVIAMSKGLLLMSGSGTTDGVAGDHLVVAPPLTITAEELDLLEVSLKEWWGKHQEEYSW